MDWLGDNLENIGFGIGVLSLLLSVAFWWQSLKPKTLDWQLDADEVIIGTGSESIKPRLSVAWEDNKLEHPRLISLRVINTGKREITANDLVPRPITVIVPDSYIVVGFVTDCSPGSHATQPELDVSDFGEEAKILPLLLNPKEFIAIQLLVDGNPGKPPQVSARFAGQSRAMRDLQEGEELSRGKVLLISAYVLFIPVGLLAILRATGNFQDAGTYTRAAMVATAFIVLGMGAAASAILFIWRASRVPRDTK